MYKANLRCRTGVGMGSTVKNFVADIAAGSELITYNKLRKFNSKR